MNVNELYDAAKNYAAVIRNVKPEFCSDAGSTVTLIVTDGSEIVSGVTGVKVCDNDIAVIPSEFSAMTDMISMDKTRAKQMVTVSLVDYSIVRPCNESLVCLCKIDVNNYGCEVVVSESEIQFVSDLISTEDSEEKSSILDNMGAPADFANGFDFDDDNPFLDTKNDASETEAVPTLQYANDAPPAAFGGGAQGYQQGYPQGAQFNGQPMQGSFGGQPMQNRAFSGQPMYQQPMYPQQQMYAQQQPMYPQQAGYPQQAYQQPMHPQQQMYPQQQPMYPQQAGYPQQQQAYQSQPVSTPLDQAAPYKQAQVNSGSVYTDKSEMVSQYLGEGGGAFKKRLGSFLGDEQEPHDSPAAPEVMNPQLSTSELKRLAKEKKKAAKSQGRSLF